MKLKRCGPWICGTNMGNWDTGYLFRPWPQVDPRKVSGENILLVKLVAKTICDQIRDVVIPDYTGGRASEEWPDSLQGQIVDRAFLSRTRCPFAIQPRRVFGDCKEIVRQLAMRVSKRHSGLRTSTCVALTLKTFNLQSP